MKDGRWMMDDGKSEMARHHPSDNAPLTERGRLPLLSSAFHLPSSVLLLLLLLLSGCVLPGEGSRTLRFRPDSRHIDYEYDFSNAYAAPSPDGGYDLVMTSGFAPKSEAYEQKLYPALIQSMSQVIHVHVAWRPARGAKSDFPAATNTNIQWHVFHREPGKTPSRITYSGIGYTAVELGEDSTLFELRDVRLQPVTITGNLHDPFGPAQVLGSVRAVNDASAVRDILSQLDRELESSEVAPTTKPSTEPAGTPPARVTGP